MIVFPASGPKPLYYQTFGQYLINILIKFDIISLRGSSINNYYEVEIENKLVIFDFSDHYDVPVELLNKCKIPVENNGQSNPIT